MENFIPSHYASFSGDFCKPCNCSGNINVTDPEACDRVSGLCLKCLDNTEGDACERCENWYFGDAVTLKNCRGMAGNLAFKSCFYVLFLYRVYVQQRWHGNLRPFYGRMHMPSGS